MAEQLIAGDCLTVLPTLDADSFDAIVTDPPYGLHFMGKSWDRFGGPLGVDHNTTTERSGSWHAGKYDHRPAREFEGFMRTVAVAALRVAKPGAHLVACGGTRTFHRLTCAIEDAGWEIRDCLMWLYGSGFPKSFDVSKAIDKAAGAERETVATRKDGCGNTDRSIHKLDGFASSRGPVFGVTVPATDLARQWDGWGTALKPAWEPIILARKPLIGTVAANVTAHGTGALNIDGCRIGTDTIQSNLRTLTSKGYKGGGYGNPDAIGNRPDIGMSQHVGRWPANLVLDEDAAALLDEQSGERTTGDHRPYVRANRDGFSGPMPERSTFDRLGDTGGASRFFYTAKAPRRERNEGVSGVTKPGGSNAAGYTDDVARGVDRNRPTYNNHPTVKPVALLTWLIRLVTPPRGHVLDPFMGSGSTGVAAFAEGAQFTGIELDADMVEIAKQRMGLAAA